MDGSLKIFNGIHPGTGSRLRLTDRDLVAVPQHPQLFELFQFFRCARWPTGKDTQIGKPIGVDAYVSANMRPWHRFATRLASWLVMWNRRARKVNRMAGLIGYYLND